MTIIDCPKCGEGDERAVGMNKCGLCECEFFVACNGSSYAPAKKRPPALCPTCRGRKYEESPPFMEWADEDTRVLSTIKIRCRVCKGAGTVAALHIHQGAKP